MLIRRALGFCVFTTQAKSISLDNFRRNLFYTLLLSSVSIKEDNDKLHFCKHLGKDLHVFKFRKNILVKLPAKPDFRTNY